MEGRRSAAEKAPPMVSIIAGEPGFPQEAQWVQGFSAGARSGLPDVDIRVTYSYEYDDQEVCERIANEQIDAGSGGSLLRQEIAVSARFPE